jgi:hypothetical protein
MIGLCIFVASSLVFFCTPTPTTPARNPPFFFFSSREGYTRVRRLSDWLPMRHPTFLEGMANSLTKFDADQQLRDFTPTPKYDLRAFHDCFMHFSEQYKSMFNTFPLLEHFETCMSNSLYASHYYRTSSTFFPFLLMEIKETRA